MLYNIACDYAKDVSKQVYVDYCDGYLVTKNNTYEIAEYENQEVKIKELIQTVKPNDEIEVSVSKINGDLIEVNCLEKTVYKKELFSIVSFVIAAIILIIPMLSLCIFFLVVTNIKNPNKRIAKIQSKYLLIIHSSEKMK